MSSKTKTLNSIASILKSKQWSLATAESCTGGMIASEITSISGASDFFMGSIIAYNNDWKTNWLQVNSRTIKKYGAVSFQTAKEMVEGLTKHFAVDCGISVTGIAGPAGGTKEKPVGLTFIATMIPSGDGTEISAEVDCENDAEIEVKEYNFSGTRDEIRITATLAALKQFAAMIGK